MVGHLIGSNLVSLCSSSSTACCPSWRGSCPPRTTARASLFCQNHTKRDLYTDSNKQLVRNVKQTFFIDTFPKAFFSISNLLNINQSPTVMLHVIGFNLYILSLSSCNNVRPMCDIESSIHIVNEAK